MELTFSELSKREVINIADGKSYGRVCDIVFNYPEGQIFGIVAPGRRGWNMFKCRNEVFIEFRKIKKIGRDVVLVDMRSFEPNKHSKCCNEKPYQKSEVNVDMSDYE